MAQTMKTASEGPCKPTQISHHNVETDESLQRQREMQQTQNSRNSHLPSILVPQTIYLTTSLTPGEQTQS